jgi:hypothetical protein
LRKLDAVREHSVGWQTPCPDLHASDGFAVLVRRDEKLGRYRFECVDAAPGDPCANERDLVRLLGLDETELGLGANGATPTRPWGTLADVEITPIRYADRPLLQAAAFHMVVGEKGCGKGTWLAHVTACVTRGELGPKRHVIWIAAGEDSLSVDVKPRILAAEGDDKLVIFPEFRPRLPDDIAEIQAKAKDIGSVGLIVLDPIAGIFPSGGKRSTNADTDVREAIDPLNGLADELDCLIAGVRHLGKDRTRGALAAVLGSVDWVNVPRAVLAIAADSDDDELRHVQVIAGNRVPPGESGRSFRIVGVRLPQLGDDAEPVTRASMFTASSEDVESLLQRQGSSRGQRVPGERLRALVLRELETGEKSREYLNTVASDETGASADSLYNSALNPLRKQGAIAPRKDGLNGGWYWHLDPEDA